MWLSLLFALSLASPSLTLAEVPQSLSPAATKGIEQALDKLVAEPVFEKLEVGASVRCVDEASPLARNGTQKANPASGAKLLSTAAALVLLGPEHRFVTRLEGALSKDGTLSFATLVAGGDPGLEVSDLARLADLARAAGVKVIKGDLTIDLSHFAGSTTAPAYDQKNTDAAYRPEVTPFAVGSAAINVTVKPGKKVGDPVDVSVSPSSASVKVESSAKTLEGKRLDKLVIESKASANGTRIIVTGGLGVSAKPQGTRKRLHGASWVAGELLGRQLEAAGIDFKGKTRVLESGEAPSSGPSEPSNPGGSKREIARIESRPLSELVATINQTSNNFMAEVVFKQLGGKDGPDTREATWERAVQVATAVLKGMRLGETSFQLVNGSGLYDATKVTPDGMTALLVAMNGDHAHQVAFGDSLAVSGQSGTLRHRLKSLGGRVRGKTGTLDNALTLSGYLERPDCRLAFAVMVNGSIGKHGAKVVKAIDVFVSSLGK
jgi:D-alanyl-D-alanine carboxypeptidase/D-alanyl-D-alanine-endopeptidase (penicillin-binding protein 4)